MKDEKLYFLTDKSNIFKHGQETCHGCSFFNMGDDTTAPYCSLIASLGSKAIKYNWEDEFVKVIQAYGDISTLANFRFTFCPLKSLPESKNEEPEKSPLNLHQTQFYRQGWNEALRALQGLATKYTDQNYCKKYLRKVQNDVHLLTDEDREFHCGCCNNSSFTEYRTSDEKPVYACNHCEAVYMQEEDSREE